MHLSELKTQHVSQLLEMATSNEIDGANRMRKQELIFALLKNRAKKGDSIFGEGTLEVLPDGFGFLRSPDTSYLASTDDIYVSPSQIRRFNLHTGDSIEGEIRTPKDGERYFALVKVDKVNGELPEAAKNKILFENLTPLHPDKAFKLERDSKAEAKTRLARAYNTVVPASGKVLTGGVDANALQKPKRFFGAARNVEEGGSLTIIATALIDTGSRMDDVIYEEFKGTGNMEVHLDRRMHEKRIYPAINVNRAGTRPEDVPIEQPILQKVWVLRKLLFPMDELEAAEFLIDKLQATKSNAEVFDTRRRG